MTTGIEWKTVYTEQCAIIESKYVLRVNSEGGWILRDTCGCDVDENSMAKPVEGESFLDAAKREGIAAIERDRKERGAK